MKRIGMGMALAAVVAVGSVAGAAVKPTTKATNLPAVWEKAGAQERIKALRVAELDAARLLVERIYGVQLNAESSVFDLVLEDDTVGAEVRACVKGVTSTEEPEYLADGTVQVVRAVKLRQVLEVITRSIKERKVLGRVKIEDIEKVEIQNRDTVIDVMGNGALPGTPGLLKIQAKRAAEVDAYRRLAERLMGFQLSSETKVRDFVLESDRMASAVAQVVRGAKPVRIAYAPDNSCEVEMQIKIADIIRVIKYHSSRARESLQITTEIETKTFTETGRGAPRPAEEQGDAVTAATTGDAACDLVIKKVVSQVVVLE